MARVERVPSCTLPLHDPTQWPLRMTREEVAHCIRKSVRTLFRLLDEGKFPAASSDGMWARVQVSRYLEGGIDRFDAAHRRKRRAPATEVRV